MKHQLFALPSLLWASLCGASLLWPVAVSAQQAPSAQPAPSAEAAAGETSDAADSAAENPRQQATDATQELEALEALALEVEELFEPAAEPPQISLHAVYDEAFPKGRDTQVREMVLIMAQQWQFPEVRENLQVDVQPLVDATQLQLSSYEEGPLGPALRLQYNRAAGRVLEAWARQHHGQRLAVVFEGKLLVAEPASEGLGRRIHVPLYLPIRRADVLNWDGRTQIQRDRDTRDQQAFEYALDLESSGILDWGRRGISLGDTMDSALDGDVLSNRLLVWIALNSGGEADQQAQLSQLCWLAARDQFALWQRLLEQWPLAEEREQIVKIIAAARPPAAGGDPQWETFFKARTAQPVAPDSQLPASDEQGSSGLTNPAAANPATRANPEENPEPAFLNPQDLNREAE